MMIINACDGQAGRPASHHDTKVVAVLCNCSFCLTVLSLSASNSPCLPAPPALSVLGPTPRLEHSRNRLPEREARHHADLRTRVPGATSDARNGARRPALPGRRDNLVSELRWWTTAACARSGKSGADLTTKNDRPSCETRLDLRALASVREKV